jgi:hypothetical protein
VEIREIASLVELVQSLMWERHSCPASARRAISFLQVSVELAPQLHFCPQTYLLAMSPNPPSGLPPNWSSRVAFLLTTNLPL